MAPPSQQPPSGTGGASRELQIIAAKFHSRSVELAKEREALVKAQADCEAQLLKEAQVRTQVVQTRCLYLQATRQAHGIELELRRLEQQRQECQTETTAAETEAQAFRQELSQQEQAWNDQVVQTLLAPHQLKRQLYQRHLSASILASKNARERRHRQLETIQKRIETMQTIERPQTMQQQKHILQETERLKQQEDTENETVQQLAATVRQKLAQRSELRTALRKAQDAHKAANQLVQHWEQQLTAAGSS